MRPYVVWAPPYTPHSGGVKLLHWLVHELNRTGRQAFVTWVPGNISPNPEWNEPAVVQPRGDFVAVYPETQRGNPLQAPVVARWALNVPGRLGMVGHRYGQWMNFPPGTDPQWKETDLIFPFARAFNIWGLPEERILHIPMQDIDGLRDQGKRRRGRLVYVGKGAETPRVAETEGLPEISKEVTGDRKQMARVFNRCELLYSYDTQTGLVDIARLCGCPVVLIPNEHTTREALYNGEMGADGIGWGIEETEKAIATIDAEAVRQRCLDLMDEFYVKLDTFVRLTQEAPPAR